MRGQQDDLGGGPESLDLAQHLDSIGVAKLQIQQHDVELFRFKLLPCGGTVGHAADTVPLGAQGRFEHHADRALIVDYQDFGGLPHTACSSSAIGSTIVNVVPSPGLLCALIRPTCRSMIALLVYRPRPMPRSLVVW